MPVQRPGPDDALRCEWIASGERCRYPGAFSDGTLGAGPWYCSGHSRAHNQTAGAAIVHQSITDVPHVDYSYEARRAAFLKRPDAQPNASHLVAQIRSAFLASGAARVGATPMSNHMERQPGSDDE